MRRGVWRAALLFLASALPISGASAAAPPPWPNTNAARAEAETRLDQLQRLLRSQPSATLVLGRWCATHRLAAKPRILARPVRGPAKPPPRSVRRNLDLRPGEAVGYRRVQLLCGDLILSDADNWYVPDRLTPAMNDVLDHSDTPFGLAVRGLHFRRRTLSSVKLWSPSAASGGTLALPDHLLRNEGLLTIGGGLPISQVIERYTAAILGAPP